MVRQAFVRSVTLRCAIGLLDSASPTRNRQRTAGVVSLAFFVLTGPAFALMACNSQTSVQPSPTPVSSSGLALVVVGEMGTPRAVHTSTRLADGRVLVAGGCTDSGCNLGSAGGATAEIFDPATGRFSPTGRLHLSRDDHQAVLLPDGRVLIAGGWTSGGVTSTTELYDPHKGTFAAGPDMTSRRAGFTAVAMSDGRVLLAGGDTANHKETATADIFDPHTNAITAVGNMIAPRVAHAATLLTDGRVLVAGGMSNGSVISEAELFDPKTNQFTSAGSMLVARYKSGSVTLADGHALIVGGAADVDGRHPFTSTELYDPKTGRFSAGPQMITGRYKLIDSMVRLPDGDVIVAGGAPRPEVLSMGAGEFQNVIGSLGATRLFLTATAIDDHRVLLVGGYDLAIRPTAQAWMIE